MSHSKYELELIEKYLNDFLTEMKAYSLSEETEALVEQELRPILMQCYLQGKQDEYEISQKLDIYK